MSVSSEIIEFIKQSLLPEIQEVKTDLAESQAEYPTKPNESE